MPQTTEDKIKDILVQSLCLDATEITPASSLREDLGADSLDMAELSIMLEEAFDIAPFTDAEGDAMKTVRDVMKTVEKKIAEREKAVV
jgi:acyl carrier protein